MEARSSSRSVLGASVAIVALAVACYLPSLRGAFLLDDLNSVVENPWIRSLWSPGSSLWSVPHHTLHGRPVAAFSFALGQAVFGPSPWAVHAVNLAIHVANALLIFAIARRARRESGSETLLVPFSIAA